MSSTKQQNMGGRMLPHNLEAEQGVLSCFLIDNDSTIGAFSQLTENDFYSPSHKTIFKTMRSIYERGNPVDFVTVVSALDTTGKLESIGGIAYITTLNDLLPSSANFKYYLEILGRSRVLRKLITASNQIIETSYTTEDAQTALSQAEKAIFDISREDERKELTSLASELPAVIDRLDTIQRDPASVRGLKSGFFALDNLTNGFQKSDLIIIAARPSVGKTALSLNIVLNAAIKYGAKCAVFSLEMSKRSLASRALCSVGKVSLSKAMKGELGVDEWRRLWEANKRLSEAGIYVDDNSVITPAEIMRKCMRLKREQGLDFVMIDYLGLMGSGSSKQESRQVTVSENSRMIKIMAKELDVPVLLLSQLNRGIESRKGADSKPMLSDLRESGAVEQDADIVMFIHKEKREESEDGEITRPVNETEEIELVIAKHRNGPVGSVKVGWVGEWTSFVNLGSDQKAQDARDAISKKSGTKERVEIKQENKKEESADEIKQGEIKQPKVANKAKSEEKAQKDDVLDVF